MAESSSEQPRILRSIVLIGILIAGASGMASCLYAFRTTPPRRALAAPPPLVESVVVEAGDLVEWFLGYGTAGPDRRANVAAEVAGTILERVGGLEAGSVVAAGQPLLRLDDREYRYLLDQAEALVRADQAAVDELAVGAQTLARVIGTAEKELRVAEEEQRRVTDLFERGLAAKKEYDFAKLAYQQARRTLQGYQMELAQNGPRQARAVASKQSYEANARLARLNIERCQINAPFAGAIEALFVDVGDRVGPGSVLLTLIDAGHVEIPLQLPAAVYDRVSVGAFCNLRSESLPGVEWQGAVARVAPHADEQTRTFAVYVDVDNARQPQPLVPGTFVTADVRGATYHDRIAVQRGAIRDDRILVVEDGVTRARRVTVERLIADRAVVSGDLRNGDRIVLSHLAKLEDGSLVRTATALSSCPVTPSGAGDDPPESSP